MPSKKRGKQLKRNNESQFRRVKIGSVHHNPKPLIRICSQTSQVEVRVRSAKRSYTVADPGFPRRGAPIAKMGVSTYYFDQYFLKTASK